MKCLNMEILGILYFLANFIVIYSVDVRQNKPSRTQVDDKIFINKLDRNCPNVSGIIRANKLENYTINCKTFPEVKVDITEENVLQQACWLVKNFLNSMCESRLDVSPDLLKQSNDSVCPFNFSHLEQYQSLIDNALLKELTIPDDCPKVCYDLKTLRPQCLVLSNMNNFFKSLNQSANRVAPKTTKPEQNNTTQSESGLVSTTPEKQQGKNELITEKVLESKPKNVTTPIKIVKPTPNFVQEVPMTEIKNEPSKKDEQDEKPPKEDITFEKPETKLTPQMSEHPKSDIKTDIENEDLNIEGVEGDDDDDDVGPPEEIKSDINQVPPNVQGLESFENKLDSSPSGKEIYSGEGFFQAEDSHFFFYFIMVSSIIVVGYLAFHNKNKILAYALEGSSGRRSRRRPNPARYRKLETNLEEVISSSATNTAASSVVY